MKHVRLPMAEIVIAVVAFGALAAAIYLGARQGSEANGKYDSYSTYDFASGGYRAWYELLQREGVRVERFERRPAFLDGSVDVYISASNIYGAIAGAQSGSSAEADNEGDWDALAKWVRSGGRFVWLADGVTEPLYMNAPEVGKAGPSSDDAIAIAPHPLTDGVQSVSGTSKLRVLFKESGSSAPLIADDTGGVVVSYPLGKGVVTIVTDESLFKNERLTRADNARLAYDLAVTGLTPHGTVAFDEWLHGYVSGDTWWSILPRPFQAALIAIAVALAALVVGTALRFGPAARLPDESERTSAEYLTSMAFLYERGRAVNAAIAELADPCMHDVASALGLSESANARILASRAGGEDDPRGDAIMNLDRLRALGKPDQADLVRAAKLCAFLRKEFIRHGRIGIGRRTPSARRSA